MKLNVNYMVFCLTDEGIKKIKKAIKDGKINPNKLLAMTSAERRAFLAKFLSPEQAKMVNIEFEKKLLLKNQEKGLVNWAREITGMTTEQKAETAQKIKDAYAEKRRRKFNPSENESFLNELTADIYAKRYRAEVYLEEAQTITELGQDMLEAESKKNENGTWDSYNLAIDYGAKKVAYDNYIRGLERETRKKEFIIPKRLGQVLPATARVGSISFNFIAENARSLKASFDNSFWLRQGIKVMFTHPKIFFKNFFKSFSDISKTLGGGNKAGDVVLDAVKADAYSRENFEKYTMGKYTLDIGVSEEEFPTDLPTKIPGLGRFFKVAEVAYEAGAMRLRVDLADKLYSIAEKNGVDMKDKEQVGAINRLVNSMTGRGSLPLSPKVQKFANTAFFSIKFAKSNLDTLTGAWSEKTDFTRKQAAINLLKIITSMAAILSIATLLGADVEDDPTSSDFGKIKVGNTRFDISGGMLPFIVLAARLKSSATGGTMKSTITGLKKEFGGFGAPDGTDLISSFLENKLSPIGQLIKDIINRKTFNGDRPTIQNELKNLTIPMVLEGSYDANKIDGLAMGILSLIADGLGASANTYSFKDNWSVKDTKEMNKFRDKVDTKTFDKANAEYNEMVSEYLNSDEYKNLSDEDKEKELTKKKSKLKKKIINKYD